MLKTVIFDFDGVITDSEILHLRSFNQALKPFNIEISTDDYYSDYLGLTDRDLIETLNTNSSLNLDSSQIENLLVKKRLAFETLAKIDAKIIDGVCDFLEMLRDNKITMAICSGALLGEIELILNANNLKSFFEIIVSAEMVERGKPFPDGFLLTLEMLNLKETAKTTPSECIVVEDSHWGIDAAKAAGMHTIAVTNSYDADMLSSADIITENLASLNLETLQNLCS